MKVGWSPRSVEDLARLVDFAAATGADAVAIGEPLLAAVERVADFPRLGERLPRFRHRDVRRLVVGTHEIRYEVRLDAIIIARIFSTREQRF